MKNDSNMAFLDTLSCGLGGVMILLFIFAALNDTGFQEDQTLEIIASADRRFIVREMGDAMNVRPLRFKLLSDSATCKVTLRKPPKEVDIKTMDQGQFFFGASYQGSAQEQSGRYKQAYQFSIWDLKEQTITLSLSDCNDASVAIDIQTGNQFVDQAFCPSQKPIKEELTIRIDNGQVKAFMDLSPVWRAKRECSIS